MKAARGKYAVSAMLPSDSDRKLLDYLDDLEIELEFLDPAPSAVDALGILDRLRRRVALFRSETALTDRILARPDLSDTIVHIDMGFWQSFRSLYRLSGRANVFMTVHTALPPVGKIRSLVWWVKGNLLSRRPRFRLLASNEEARKGVRPYITSAMFDKIEVAYSGYDPDEVGKIDAEVQSTRDRYGIRPAVPLIVTSGQFIERKGCWTVLESLKHLRASGQAYVFLWLATSIPDAAAMARIAEYGLGELFRLLTPDDIGPTRHDLLTLVAAADIFVLASLQEGLPISLIEAMELGRPSVATRIGAIPEAITDGKNGILIAPSDPDELAAAIIDLINDKAKRERLGAAGAETVRASFNAARAAEEVVDIYDSVWQT
ncbi:MAG: glycosyltransferase family 4 protein [Chloracidobacterium sp.]|nr:glycosyltransferase family 4 protein [Chloracidobacterium sp.]